MTDNEKNIDLPEETSESASAQNDSAPETAPELAELELAYAPPFNSAKDPVNFLGMIAQNVLDGMTEPAYADSIPADALVVDVREEAEHQAGAIPGAVNIPLGQLRGRLGELDRSRELIVSCQVGLRGYLAERILKAEKRLVLAGGLSAANLAEAARIGADVLDVNSSLEDAPGHKSIVKLNELISIYQGVQK